MKRTGFKTPGKPLRRTPFTSKTKPMKKVSKAKADYRASDEGKAARKYVGMVKQLPCAVCGAPGPSDAHHVIHDRYGSRKSSDFDVVPLCKLHHQDGPDAIHNGKESWREKYGPDHGLIEQTRKRVGEMI